MLRGSKGADSGDSSYDGSVFVPSIPGYRIIRYRRIEDHLDACTYGLKAARVKIEDRIVTIFIGMGISPIDSGPYIRTIAIHHEVNGSDQPFGMALEGNPLSPDTSPGRGMTFNYLSESHLLMFLEQKRVLETVMTGLKKFGAIMGASVNSKAISLAFEYGLIEDLLAVSLINKDIPGGIARWDQDSVESCTELCFEVGLGISPDDEENAYAQVLPHEPVSVAEVHMEPGIVSEYRDLLRFILSHIGKGKALEGFILQALAHNKCELVTTNNPVQSLLVTGDKNLFCVGDIMDVTIDPGPIVFRPAHHLTQEVVLPYRKIPVKRLGSIHVGTYYAGQFNWNGVHGDILVYHSNRGLDFGFNVY